MPAASQSSEQPKRRAYLTRTSAPTLRRASDSISAAYPSHCPAILSSARAESPALRRRFRSLAPRPDVDPIVTMTATVVMTAHDVK